MPVLWLVFTIAGICAHHHFHSKAMTCVYSAKSRFKMTTKIHSYNKDVHTVEPFITIKIENFLQKRYPLVPRLG